MKTVKMTSIKTIESYWNSYRNEFDQSADELLSSVLFDACSLSVDEYARLEANYSYSRFQSSKIARQYFYDMEILFSSQVVHGDYPIYRNTYIDKDSNISIVFSHSNFNITFNINSPLSVHPLLNKTN